MTETAPVPAVIRFAFAATTSVCEVTDRFLPLAKMMSPFRFTVSLAPAALMASEGNPEVGIAPTLIVSLPVPGLMKMSVMPESEMFPEFPLIGTALFTLKVRPVAARRIWPATGWEISSVSLPPDRSVTKIWFPVVLTE